MKNIVIGGNGAYCQCGRLIAQAVWGPSGTGTYFIQLGPGWNYDESAREWTKGKYRGRRPTAQDGAVQPGEYVVCPSCHERLRAPHARREDPGIPERVGPQPP